MNLVFGTNKGTTLQTLAEREHVDRETFENEILPTNQPVVLRGLVRDWPAVQAGQQSPARMAAYIKQFDSGNTVSAFVGPPQIDGRFFYANDFRSFNFDSKQVSVSVALDALVSLAETPQPPAMALQAIEVPRYMPSFAEDNALSLISESVAPRIWISNRSIVAPHFDTNYNIACVVGGRRQFTLYPPDQVENLYIGPLLTTPGGPPISTVDIRNPDLEKHPRYAQALDHAQQATLEPGDAIYIPILWWHAVETLDPLGALVNYWWNEDTSDHHDLMLSLIHSMVLMSGVSATQREAWRSLFDCFVFQKAGHPGAHLPSDVRDVMGNLSPADKEQVLALIAKRM